MGRGGIGAGAGGGGGAGRKIGLWRVGKGVGYGRGGGGGFAIIPPPFIIIIGRCGGGAGGINTPPLIMIFVSFVVVVWVEFEGCDKFVVCGGRSIASFSQIVLFWDSTLSVILYPPRLELSAITDALRICPLATILASGGKGVVLSRS